MKENVFYNYINLSAFLNLLRFENVRNIKITDLKKYRNSFLEKIGDDLGNEELGFFSDNVNDSDALNSFLDKYKSVVYMKGDTLYLRDDVVEADLFILLSGHKELVDKCYSPLFQYEILKSLDFCKITNALTELLNLEKEIEKGYKELNLNDKKQMMKLKKKLFMRTIFLCNLTNSSSDFIKTIKFTSSNLCFDVADFEYDIFPLSFDLWENEEFYNNDKDSMFDEVSDNLFWIYQYAIFGDDSLNAFKLWKVIDDVYFSSDEVLDVVAEDEALDDEVTNMDEEIDFDDFDNIPSFFMDSDERDYIFYLTYIDKLNKYFADYGINSELLKTKNRLLYVLDKPETGLFDEENFKLEYENALFNANDGIDLTDLEDETRFMASEVFLVPEDKNTIKKVLFISAYYELNEDEKIKDIMSRHSNHEKYDEYNTIVFGKQKRNVKSIN